MLTPISCELAARDKVFPRLLKQTTKLFARRSNSNRNFEDFAGKTRGDWNANWKIYRHRNGLQNLRGFIKLLIDRSEFETASVAEPSEIRKKSSGSRKISAGFAGFQPEKRSFENAPTNFRPTRKHNFKSLSTCPRSKN